MRREGTGAGQSVLLACASAPGSTFEFTFRHPLRKHNTFPSLPPHSKLHSKNIPIHNLSNSQRAFNKVFDSLNKENKPAPFVFGAPQPPPFTFSLSPPKQDSTNPNTNAAVLTEQSNSITNASAEYRPSSQKPGLTTFIPANTRHFSTKTPWSEVESEMPKTAPEHHDNEVVFSIASANTFFKETHPITNSHIKNSDDSDSRQMNLAMDGKIATNIPEDKSDIVYYTTATYAGSKRKEKDSEDDISDLNVSKRRRRNRERPQNLSYTRNISLKATGQTAASREKGTKSVSRAQQDDHLLDKQIIVSRSYHEEDLDALLVAQNTTTMMNQPGTPQKLKESSVVVIRSIRTVDDLFEELDDDARTIASLERSTERDDNGSELIYVHRGRRVNSGVNITEIPWAAGDSSDEDEIQVLRSMPRILFPKPPMNAPRLDPKDFENDYIFI